VPVEAQAAGLPVIAYGRGGAGESVIDGRTGVLFEEQTAAGLAGAIERFQALHLEEADLRANAARFGRARFRREMAEAIERAADGQGAAPGPPGAVAAAASSRPAP
jgi:glycosyltransferase involved in cell wall biosynthesis